MADADRDPALDNLDGASAQGETLHGL